jgi:hypothetical protein
MESSTLLSCLQSDIQEMALKVFQSVFYKRKWLFQKRKKCIQVVIASLCVIICLHLTMSIVELEEHHSLTKGKYK